MKFNNHDWVEKIRLKLPEAIVGITPGTGEDHNLDEISVRIPGCRDRISVNAFKEECLTKEEHTAGEIPDCYFVELRDSCSDSAGGIQSNNEKVQVAGAKIKALLKQKGLCVAGHYNHYF